MLAPLKSFIRDWYPMGLPKSVNIFNWKLSLLEMTLEIIVLVLVVRLMA